MSVIYVRKDGVFVPVSMGGGSSGGSKTRVVDIDLIAENWTGSDKHWTQVVHVHGSTDKSEVNLTPSVEQLIIFREKDLTFSTENDGGVVTVHVIGQRPQNDYTIQADVVEVSR